MRHASQLLLLFIFVPALACRQASEAPYGGLEQRAIKALAPTEVEAYLRGEGMGYALAAELNHYPGPKHSLELAERLGLSDSQLQQTQAIFNAMADSAKQLGQRIVESERRLDEFFASGFSDSALLEQYVTEIAALEGALRYRHLAAHLGMRRLLSPDQIAEYDRLRGYSDGGTGEHTHQEGSHPASHEPE